MIKYFRRVWGDGRAESAYLHRLFPRAARKSRATAWRGSRVPRASTEVARPVLPLLAFPLFLWVHAPMLVSPRADGGPG